MHRVAELLNEIRELEQFRPRPLVIAFRFKSSPPELAALLTKWIPEFLGETRWHFNPNGPGINWVLGAQRCWDYAQEHQDLGVLSAADCLAKEDPEFTRRAEAELLRLAEYLRDRWRQQQAQA